MQKRRNVLGVGVSVGLVMGILTMASGCVAPPENQEPAETEAETEGEMGTVSHALDNPAACTYAANGEGTLGLVKAQNNAVKALKYVLGSQVPLAASCSASVTAKLNYLRGETMASRLRVTGHTIAPLCGLSANRVKMTQTALQPTPNTGPLWDAINDLAVIDSDLDTCFGLGASTFFVWRTGANNVSGQFQNWVEFDPSPATLTATLFTGANTKASAHYATTDGYGGATTYVYRWSANGGVCGGLAGMACTTTAGLVATGTVITKVLQEYDGTCYCW